MSQDFRLFGRLSVGMLACCVIISQKGRVFSIPWCSFRSTCSSKHFTALSFAYLNKTLSVCMSVPFHRRKALVLRSSRKASLLYFFSPNFVQENTEYLSSLVCRVMSILSGSIFYRNTLLNAPIAAGQHKILVFFTCWKRATLWMLLACRPLRETFPSFFFLESNHISTRFK